MMKRYIKPELIVVKADVETILAASPSITVPGNPEGKDPQEGASKKHGFTSLWDETWDTNDEDANE